MNKEETIRAQWDALGQQQYEFGQIAPDGRTWNDIRRWENLRQKLERYTVSNEEKKENIYIRPVPADKHDIIFLDDLTVTGVSSSCMKPALFRHVLPKHHKTIFKHGSRWLNRNRVKFAKGWNAISLAC